MRRAIALFILSAVIVLALVSCTKNEKREINRVLFVGDDLMETSEIYNYFSELCKSNEKENIIVDYECIEDARMYTFAGLCESDEAFAKRVAEADLIVFEEGTAETATTASSINKIREYANNPKTVCLCLYGYPCWMYREEFEDKGLKNIDYADADYFIKKVIAAEDTPIGYEHLCMEDYIHPNHLNGLISAEVLFCEVFCTMPQYINLSSFDNDIRIAECADCEPENVAQTLYAISDIINEEMK